MSEVDKKGHAEQQPQGNVVLAQQCVMRIPGKEA